MFRLPHYREIIALFYSPNSVAGASKVLSDTAKRLDGVYQHHCDHADLKTFKSADLRCKASALDTEALRHQQEAGRAAKVASRLEELLA